jgi:hypothetical protein
VVKGKENMVCKFQKSLYGLKIFFMNGIARLMHIYILGV